VSSAAPRRLDFRDHRRELDDNQHVYAVVSRRSRGLSIGINLNRDKVCTWDCPYCQVDRRSPGGPRGVDLDRLSAELDRLLTLVRSGELWEVPPFSTAAPALRRVNDIAFAGDGEPTSPPAFAEAARRVIAARAAHGLDGVRLLLLTNAELLHRPAVIDGVDALAAAGGELWAKLDAGTPAGFARAAGLDPAVAAGRFDRCLSNLELAARRWPLTLQCMFFTWEGQGPSEAEAAAWADRVLALLAAGGRLREVQVYGVARTPARPEVGVLPADALQSLADRLAPRLAPHGVPVTVFAGLPPAGAPAS